MPARRAAVIFSRRPRRCFFVRGALPRGFFRGPLPPVPPPRDPPPGGRLPGGRPLPPEEGGPGGRPRRPGEAAPGRGTVVRARLPPAGLRAPPVPRPPPPVLPVRTGR